MCRCGGVGWWCGDDVADTVGVLFDEEELPPVPVPPGVAILRFGDNSCAPPPVPLSPQTSPVLTTCSSICIFSILLIDWLIDRLTVGLIDGLTWLLDVLFCFDLFWFVAVLIYLLFCFWFLVLYFWFQFFGCVLFSFSFLFSFVLFWLCFLLIGFLLDVFLDFLVLVALLLVSLSTALEAAREGRNICLFCGLA